MAESTKAVHFVILVLLQAAVVLPLPEAHCSHNVASEDVRNSVSFSDSLQQALGIP